MKTNLKKAIIISVVVLLALLAISSVIFFILRATPENTAKRVMKQTFAYKPSQCAYLEILDASAKLDAMKKAFYDRYSSKDVTDAFLEQIAATTIPYEYAEIAYNSGQKTLCKNIKLEDVTRDGAVDEATYDFTASLKASDKEYELAGTVILVYEDNDWKVNYMVVSSRLEK